MSSVIGYFQGLARHQFFRSVVALASGTAVAQLIAMAALPILTRMYSPDVFSLLAVYISVLSIISVSACLRLDIAIPLPESDRDAAHLLVLALFFAFLVSLVTGGILWGWSDEIDQLLGNRGLQNYFWLLPLGVWLSASYSAFRYWNGRRKRFKAIAGNQVVQVSVGVGTQVAMGLGSGGAFGLLFGHMLYGGIGALGLAWRAWSADHQSFRGMSFQEMKMRLAEYRKFPQYSTFEALFNVAAIELPIILIASLAASPEAGYVLLVTRIMGAPLQLVGQAVGQVYLAHAADELRAGRLKSFTLKNIWGLAKIGVAPLLLFAVFAPDIFEILFGEQWIRAGVLAQWMMPWFILQFLVSPISMVLHVLGAQQIALWLQFFGMILRVGSILAAAAISQAFVAEVYAISGGLFYAVYLAVIVQKINKAAR